MKENRFIQQNKEKWQEAEALLADENKDPEKMSNLFVQVVDDLSFSRTYYPNRSVRVYLNKIARQYFTFIYSHKRKEKHSPFMVFWMEELPQVVLHCKRELLISLCVFLMAMTIGIFSSYNDPGFVNTILGDDYVAMTEKNIASGDPMAVYKQSHEIDMFLGITFNNLMVAFRTYVLGIFLGIGTLASLLFNGVMVGSFQYYFIARGLGVESALTIWLHGTLEIASIILAGGAGLTLGRGLIFPGTYSRLQSLQISGIRSLKLMLGIAPVFVLAAIIESFLTRYTDAPLFFRVFLILLSAVYLVGYFIVYPYLKSKSGFNFPLKEVRLAPELNEPVSFTRIKNNADILKDSFRFYSRYSSAILPWAFYVSVAVSFAAFFFQDEAYIFVEREWWIELFNSIFFAMETSHPVAIVVNAFATGIIFYRVMKLIHAEARTTLKTPATEDDEASSFDGKSFFQILVVTCLLYTLIYFGWWGITLLIFAFGYLIYTSFTVVTEQRGLGFALSYGFEQFRKNENQGLSLQLTVLLLSFSFLLVLSTPLLYIHTSILEWNFTGTDAWSKYFIQFTENFVKVFSFYLVLPLITATTCYLYYSQEEVESARYLKESIEKMGTRLSTSKRR